MSDGFLAFKGLGWAAAGLLAVAVVMPTSSNSQWDALRTRTDTSARSELQRPSLLKKLLGGGTGRTDGGTTTGGTTTGGTTTGGTTTGGTTTGGTTTGGTTTGSTGGTSTGTTTGTGTTGTTTGTSGSFTYSELTMIPSNFSVSSEILGIPGANIPATAAPDVVGAFRFICGPGQVLADDPIMYPGQPGMSHLHQFYGNTAADANSTYNSLRTTGQSTCMSPLNRSAYWMPALLDGKGNVVRPDYVAIYYKRLPQSDPKCNAANPGAEGNCIPLPNGLRFIFGRDMTNLAAPPTGNYHYLCQTPGGGQIGQVSTSMDAILQICPAGDQFAAVLDAPMCWDGKNLDSANHRSHVSYPSYGSWGYLKCDPNHPYVLPQFTMGARWTIGAGDDTSKWIFSSDLAMNQPRGTTFHGDWFGAWDDTVMSTWVNNCINKLLSCSGGALGNGTVMRTYSGFSWTANPRLVPIPG
jgi:hypothetical protein